MKSVTFLQDCTIYPDGATPTSVATGEVLPVEPEYAELLVRKGLAAETPEAVTPDAATPPTTAAIPGTH